MFDTKTIYTGLIAPLMYHLRAILSKHHARLSGAPSRLLHFTRIRTFHSSRPNSWPLWRSPQTYWNELIDLNRSIDSIVRKKDQDFEQKPRGHPDRIRWRAKYRVLVYQNLRTRFPFWFRIYTLGQNSWNDFWFLFWRVFLVLIGWDVLKWMYQHRNEPYRNWPRSVL